MVMAITSDLEDSLIPLRSVKKMVISDLDLDRIGKILDGLGEEQKTSLFAGKCL